MVDFEYRPEDFLQNTLITPDFSRIRLKKSSKKRLPDEPKYCEDCFFFWGSKAVCHCDRSPNYHKKPKESCKYYDPKIDSENDS